MKKIFLILIIASLVIPILAYTWLFYKNNFQGETISRQELKEAHTSSIDWLTSNKRTLLSTHNPGLWEMLAKLVSVTKNSELEYLLEEYRSKNYIGYVSHPLRFQVYGTSRKLDFSKIELHSYPYYNLLFMFGDSCDDYLKELDVVQQQLKLDFCPKHYPISPACKTHQLMGFILLKNNRCGDQQVNRAIIDELSYNIQRQLRFDVRMVDVYLQRVMLLLELERYDLIDKSWLENVLEYQNKDGGWDDSMTLIELPGKKSLSIGSKRFKLDTPDSNFHATVQGALLTAYALKAEALSRLSIN